GRAEGVADRPARREPGLEAEPRSRGERGLRAIDDTGRGPERREHGVLKLQRPAPVTALRKVRVEIVDTRARASRAVTQLAEELRPQEQGLRRIVREVRAQILLQVDAAVIDDGVRLV